MFIKNEYNYCTRNQIQIIEGSDNRGSDNRGSTVCHIYQLHDLFLTETAFSHILLQVRMKENRKVYAMKILNKFEMVCVCM